MKSNLESGMTSEPPDCDCPGSGVAGRDGAAPLSRRRLIRAGLSAGPVLLALSGKSALATGDSQSCGGCRFPSTWASVDPAAGGNTAGLSHHPSDDGCRFGRSPGFWRQPQHRCYWPRSPGPVPDSLPCGVKENGVNVCSRFLGDGTKVNDIFPGASVSGRTMQQLLCTESGTDAWHYCAAYLNAWVIAGYPLTPNQVVLMWKGMFVVGGVTWSRARGRQFIETTYNDSRGFLDFKTSCVQVPCKKV